jgi:hypothetical protein
MQKLPYTPYYLTTEERADHLLSALDAAGYAVVPKLLLTELVEAAWMDCNNTMVTSATTDDDHKACQGQLGRIQEIRAMIEAAKEE